MFECCGPRVCPFSRFYLGVARAGLTRVSSRAIKRGRAGKRARQMDFKFRLTVSLGAESGLPSQESHSTPLHRPSWSQGLPPYFAQGCIAQDPGFCLPERISRRGRLALGQSQEFRCKLIRVCINQKVTAKWGSDVLYPLHSSLWLCRLDQYVKTGCINMLKFHNHILSLPETVSPSFWFSSFPSFLPRVRVTSQTATCCPVMPGLPDMVKHFMSGIRILKWISSQSS